MSLENISIESIADQVGYPATKRPDTLSRRQFLILGAGAITSLAMNRDVDNTDIASSSAMGDQRYLGINSGESLALDTGSIYEKLTNKDLIKYSAEGIDGNAINDVIDLFNNIRSTYGLETLDMLTPEQQYMVAFWTSLNHSESTWAVLPDQDMIPQLVTSDVISRRVGIGNTLISEVLNPIMPSKGFVFSALRGLTPQSVHTYVMAKGNQFSASAYAAGIMQRHQDVAISALIQHARIERFPRMSPFFFDHFIAQKIFDPVNDGPSVASAQISWLKANPDALALMFKKYNGDPWYIVGKLNGKIQNDQLSKYATNTQKVINDIRTL